MAKSNMSDDKYLTKTEALKHGRISPSTLRRLLEDRAIKRYRRRGQRGILISVAELDAALQPQEIPA